MWEGITSSQLNRHKMRSHKQEVEREQNAKQHQQDHQPEQEIKTQPLDESMVPPSAANMFLNLGTTTDSPASAS